MTLVYLVNFNIAGTLSDDPGYVESIPKQSSLWMSSALTSGFPNLVAGKSPLTTVLAALSLATMTLIYGKLL